MMIDDRISHDLITRELLSLLYATLRYSTLLYATLPYSTLLYATLHYTTQRYSMLRPRTYPFFEDIYPILYRGQKSDIISYPISRQKIEKGYISYILSNFNLASKT
jgi:hypothetical protein